MQYKSSIDYKVSSSKSKKSTGKIIDRTLLTQGRRRRRRRLKLWCRRDESTRDRTPKVVLINPIESSLTEVLG